MQDFVHQQKLTTGVLSFPARPSVLGWGLELRAYGVWGLRFRFHEIRGLALMGLEKMCIIIVAVMVKRFDIRAFLIWQCQEPLANEPQGSMHPIVYTLGPIYLYTIWEFPKIRGPYNKDPTT